MLKSLSHSHFNAQRVKVSPLTKVLSAMETYRQRRALERLDSHLLKDLGLSKADVAAESRKSLWAVRAPVSK